jgi:hypothetical protein
MAIVSCVLAATSSAFGRTWYVTPDGTGDAPTIQAAVDSATAGDSVAVACGEYYEHNIVLKSGVVLKSTTGEWDCAVINAEALGRVLSCVQVDATTEIVGFTIFNGTTFVPDTLGAGALLIGSSPTIRSCRFLENSMQRGMGAGLALLNSSPRVEFCVFESNHGFRDPGGGIYAAGPFSDPYVSSCVFAGNSAAWGGGLYSKSAADPVVEGCVFQDNVAGGWSGGGLMVFESSSAIVRDCIFRWNTAESGGGGVVLSECNGTLERCVIVGNESIGDRGGGISVGRDCSPTIRDCTIAYNSAPSGGGLAVTNRPLTVTNSVIWANVSPLGHSVYSGFGGSVLFECCDIDTSNGWVGGNVDVIIGLGTFSADPLFCGALNGDFTLSIQSTCLPGNHPHGVDCGLVGALGQGCGPVSVEPESWAGIKSRYRR